MKVVSFLPIVILLFAVVTQAKNLDIRKLKAPPRAPAAPVSAVPVTDNDVPEKADLSLVPVDETDTRVVGGDNIVSVTANAPFVVSIQSTGGHFCAGTLFGLHSDTPNARVGTQWVLTAAQCVYGINPRLLTVRYGVSGHYYEGGTLAEVDYYIVHDEFKPPIMLNDIALIKLKHRIPNFSNTQARGLALPPGGQDSWLSSSAPLFFWGWGFDKDPAGQYGGNVLTQNLKGLLYINQLNFTECANEYRHKGVALNGPDSQLYAGQLAGGKGFCQGDIGGALHDYSRIRPFVYGIASFSIGCGAQDTPSVYTKVSHYYNWVYAASGEPPGTFD